MNQRRRSTLRAPQKDGEYVVSPATSLASLVAENRERLGNARSTSIARLSNNEVSSRRTQARRSVINEALAYSESYTDTPGSFRQINADDLTPLFLSGHQPEFFHPGVWFKNFLLGGLANAAQGIGINLTIDNDVCGTRGILVPTGSVDQPRRENVPFDMGRTIAQSPESQADSTSETNPLPYELATWHDVRSIHEFPDAVKTRLESLLDGPMILDEIWSHVRKLSRANPLVGQSIAQSRHIYEQNHGLKNLEIPLSHICRGKTFFQFVHDILRHAEPFQSLYNRTVVDFRKRNRIRSLSHPVPELVTTDGWLELPFWIWSSESPWRGALHAKLNGDRLQLSDRDEIHVSFSMGDCEEELANLAAQKIAIRPRALMTTLFIRMFLSDVFVHGIGGAKYDELTDEIMREFYGIQPPRFVTATSTHRLPLGISPFDDTLISDNRQQTRSLIYHPEHHLADSRTEASVPQWLAEKQRLLSVIPEKGQKKSWDQQLRIVNEKLSGLVQNEISQLRNERRRLFDSRKRSLVLASREYSFLLHSPVLIQKLKRISGEATAKFI